MAIASDVKEETEYRNIQENIQIKAKSVCVQQAVASVIQWWQTMQLPPASGLEVPQCQSATRPLLLLCYVTHSGFNVDKGRSKQATMNSLWICVD